MSRVPAYPRLAVDGAAPRDASRRQGGGLTAVLDPGATHGHRDFRPGNGVIAAGSNVLAA
jgi:hypothetical protein